MFAYARAAGTVVLGAVGGWAINRGLDRAFPNQADQENARLLRENNELLHQVAELQQENEARRQQMERDANNRWWPW